MGTRLHCDKQIYPNPNLGVTCLGTQEHVTGAGSGNVQLQQTETGVSGLQPYYMLHPLETTKGMHKPLPWGCLYRCWFGSSECSEDEDPALYCQLHPSSSPGSVDSSHA